MNCHRPEGRLRSWWWDWAPVVVTVVAAVVWCVALAWVAFA